MLVASPIVPAPQKYTIIHKRSRRNNQNMPLQKINNPQRNIARREGKIKDYKIEIKK